MSNSDSMSLGYVNLWLNEVPAPGEVPQMIRYDEFVRKLFKCMPIDMMKAHAVMGVAGEAGELIDCVKKEIIYGKGPIDRENLVEELGDLRFFIQAVMNLYGVSEQEILQTNGYKLLKRYKDLTYTDAAAANRADKDVPSLPGEAA